MVNLRGQKGTPSMPHVPVPTFPLSTPPMKCHTGLGLRLCVGMTLSTYCIILTLNLIIKFIIHLVTNIFKSIILYGKTNQTLHEINQNDVNLLCLDMPILGM